MRRDSKVERASGVHNGNGEPGHCAAGIMPSNPVQSALLSFHFQHFYKLSAQTSQLPTQPLNSTLPAIIIITIHDSNLWNFWWESAKLFCGINHAQNSIFNPTFPLSSLETESAAAGYVYPGWDTVCHFISGITPVQLCNQKWNQKLKSNANYKHHTRP